MSDSDDCPPPLEDMTEKVMAIKEKKANHKQQQPAPSSGASEHFAKINPVKSEGTENKDNSNISVIAPTAGEFKKINKPIEIKEEKPKAPAKKSNNFGGFSAGFLNAKPQPKKKAAPAKPQQEDLTHLKAKAKDENLKFQEVQEAMNNSDFMKQKDKWMTPELFARLAQNPKLAKAFSDPKAMAAL